MKDSRPRSPPRRENCSGLLPEVPRNRKPSPDRTGVVWPVDVLQQQNKWKEGQDLEVSISLFLYPVGILCIVECCVGLLWFSSIIICH